MKCVLGQKTTVETLAVSEMIDTLEEYGDFLDVIFVDKRGGKEPVEYSIFASQTEEVPRPTLYCEFPLEDSITVKDLLDQLYELDEDDPIVFEIEGKLEGFIQIDLDFVGEFNQLMIIVGNNE